MSNISERLRSCRGLGAPKPTNATLDEAADYIEKLEAAVRTMPKRQDLDYTNPEKFSRLYIEWENEHAELLEGLDDDVAE